MSELEVKVYRSAIEDKMTLVVTIEYAFLDVTARETAHLIAKAIADKFVGEHYADIVANLNQEAIANLAIAEASKKIAEEIQRKPNIVSEIKHSTAIYQRGILGGLKRIG